MWHLLAFFFFFSSRRRHTIFDCDWSSDVCSSDLIGLGIAKALLGAGMNVVIADIRADHLAAATAELGAAERVLALKLDVTDRAAYARAADAAEARFRTIHVLCNNAGVGVIGPTELATFADWDWVLGVNLGGTVNGIVILLPRILRHGEGGHIVNTASMSGLVPHPGATLYGTSKGAVVHMIECMRGELEPHGIICSAFCPGAVQSNIAEAGKTRPAALADTGYAETDKRRQQGGNFFHLYRTKEEVGQRVLQGILNEDRKSTRLNSSHSQISYAVFCLKKKK